MAIADRELVEQTLERFEQRVLDVLDRAMSDWLATPGRALLLYSRTRANVIFDHIARHAMAEFAGEADREVRIMKESQSVKFLFGQRVVVRFKKAAARGVGRNITTQRVLDFVEPQGRLPEVPEAERVEIVYAIDGLGTGYEDVSVVARDRRARIWFYALEDRSGSVVAMPAPTPPELVPPLVTPKRRPGARLVAAE